MAAKGIWKDEKARKKPRKINDYRFDVTFFLPSRFYA
jgi:hypothetical protein